jgi:5'-3' exonuclease
MISLKLKRIFSLREMGIPSYFRRIIQRYPGILSRNLQQPAVALCFDFNCLIYRCLRSQNLRPYPKGSYDEEKEIWENELLREVEICVKEVWEEAGRPSQVFIAVDGVVPMAKIRQQRVRRFKSAWLRTSSAEGSGWDSNSITPGTLFMDKLTTMLEGVSSKHRGWEVSGVREPGEGEHKILQWLRKDSLKKVGPVIVYGLDADLILLTMLASEQKGIPMYLLRERQEFGGGTTKQEGKQEYQFMSIPEFQNRLGVKGYEQVLQYIGLMSLMGNDFLPHSITHKLNDDGHEFVLRELKKGRQIVDTNGRMNLTIFKEVCQEWSLTEADKMLHMIQKKRDQAKRGVLQGMDEQEGLPLEWNVESVLLDKNTGGLVSNWRDLYYDWIGGRDQCKRVCQEYVFGFQWILDYYSGKEVQKTWMFPSWIPPLWSDLAKCEAVTTQDTVLIADPTPEEQLAMVLPLDSWGLIRSSAHRRLPSLAPQFWPSEFTFFSAGRKWLWECEALIPPLSAARLREILEDAKQ